MAHSDLSSEQAIAEDRLKAIADFRENYTQADLLESTVSPDPIKQFKQWFDDAVSAQIREPNAMTLATVSEDGKPAARIVLLKGVDANGFVFYTNYGSRKGKELAQTPWAALVFLWATLERQVRIEGRVDRVSDAETEAYFYSRPRGSQLGAWVSPQSEVIGDRQCLEQELERLESHYAGQIIPRPPHWGGFRVYPTQIEFWQGRPNRLHDRLNYRRMQDEHWILERLAP